MNALIRFVKKIKMSDDPDKCWGWDGSVSPNGYARIMVDGKLSYAHREMAQLMGLPITNQINHICDNRLCTRPDHIYAGTAKDNAVDRDTRGRNGTIGFNPRKLNEEDKVAIRQLALNGYCTRKQLAEMYGVDERTIYRVLA